MRSRRLYGVGAALWIALSFGTLVQADTVLQFDGASEDEYSQPYQESGFKLFPRPPSTVVRLTAAPGGGKGLLLSYEIDDPKSGGVNVLKTAGGTFDLVSLEIADYSLGEGNFLRIWSFSGGTRVLSGAGTVTFSGAEWRDIEGFYVFINAADGVGRAVLDNIRVSSSALRRRWVPFDGEPEGTAAEVVLDRRRSDPSNTYFDLRVHGLWSEPTEGPDGTVYEKLEIPGLGSLPAANLGAPDLPALSIRLAVITTAQDAVLAGVEKEDVRTVEDILPWPRQPPATDAADAQGEPFVIDEEIYGGDRPWPVDDAWASSRVTRKDGAVRGSDYCVYPVQFDPARKTLGVLASATYHIAHPGELRGSQEITRQRFRKAELTYLNWEVAREAHPWDPVRYAGEYLFILPWGYDDELLPLIQQKKARGFRVMVLNSDEIGRNCAWIRSAIGFWEADTPPGADKYCLLVGDVNAIPLCLTSTGVYTDDLYGDVDGDGVDDLDEEVYVGRLSVDDEADAANQVAKILDYEDSPDPRCCYENALLVAHREEAPGKYVANQEAVRTAAYAVPPTFTTLYGHLPGVDNADVSSAIDGGLGLVAYRGHGGGQEWFSWNTFGESYSTWDVAALTNDPHAPVVWNITCSNHNLMENDCLGEAWLERVQHGGVSSYGATTDSNTVANDALNLSLFEAVFHANLVVQSHAIAWAEAQTASVSGSAGEENSWMYLLLGDPQMTIWRRSIAPWFEPEPVTIFEGALTARVRSIASGEGVPGVLVSFWKEAPDGSDEVLDNRYTDANGMAEISVGALTPGTLWITVEDDDGNVVSHAEEIAPSGTVEFQRGDCNEDAKVDISDAVCILQWLFLGGQKPGCVAALDANVSGSVDLSDAVYLLNYLFLGGPPPGAPFPGCGPAPSGTDEKPGCETSPKGCS